MPLEKGGRADKMGNRYEIRCIIYEMLKVLKEVNYSIVIEALGNDEVGTDILITDCEGRKEHQQCKVRNASKEYWSIADLKSHNILKNWKRQLERDDNRKVALVSAVGCTHIVDLHNRAVNSTDNPNDFYEYQVKSGGKEIQDSYEYFCQGMGIEDFKIADIAKSIDFLQRIYIKQMSEYTLQENILQEINFYFATDKESVYNAFVALVIDSDIYAKEITSLELREYFTKQGIRMRMLDGDKRIVPQIERINKEYRDSFKPLKEGLIQRKEFRECIEAINAEQSFIISGNAGYGKSGCTEAILNYCEGETIPYIAIKLDRRIPHGNSQIWGQELGFPSSIVYALNAISKDKIAVLVLDQLDALRWTQANSSEALAVCMEMIGQVLYLNCERHKKIVIVLVCRTYDLENDNNIKTLINRDDNDTQKVEWKKVVIKNFDEVIVKTIVGKKYEELTLKTRRLLQVPSNLYIWQHLDEKKTCGDCETTSHLIDIWFQQICKKSNNVGVDEKCVRDTVHYVVDKLDKTGRLYALKRSLEVEVRGLDYLISAELLIADGEKIGFVHQSILDYFISNKMTEKFFAGDKIEQIVGEKNKQTPGKRYQVQMFLQNLLECDSGDFLSAGMQLVESLQVRFYVKYVFYEILRQISEPDEKIAEYVKRECKDENKSDYFVNNVVCERHVYITLLRQAGILEQWFSNEKKKNTVFTLLKSVSQDLDTEDIAFIKKHSFMNEEDDKKFMDCFSFDFSRESDEMFELRMLFYNRYPAWSLMKHLDFNVGMKYCKTRMIKIISFWLKNKIALKEKNVYQYEENLRIEAYSYSAKEGKFILNELLQYIPLLDADELYLSDWSDCLYVHKNLERTAVELLKKANIAIICATPEVFWKYYSPYMGKNYAIFNELILHGFQFLPESYSNQVVEYLTGGFDKKVFNRTSRAKDQLELAKKALKIHTKYCTEECLNSFLESVEKYISPRSSEWYKRRIECNKQKECLHVYWSFWGDFQYHILQCIAPERLAPKYRDLLNVLERKFQGKTDRYINSNGHSGWVKSPVSEKKIGKKQWLQIITNDQMPDRNRSQWKEVNGGFIESSLSMYAEDFQSIVKHEPVEMIKMVIENRANVVPVYIDAMYSGAEASDAIGTVEKNLWEEMFKAFPCGMNSQRTLYFCGIIEKVKIYSWSEEVINKLREVALYSEEEEAENIKDIKKLSCEELIIRSLNYMKGHAIRAIGHLLWDNQALFVDFKEVIDKLTLDEDEAVRMACFYALRPIYNIDREWAEKRILRIYESDDRMAGFYDSKELFFRLYPKYKSNVLALVQRCFKTNDEQLIRMGGNTICEFYIKYNEFESIMSNMGQLNEKQVNAILHMAVKYLKFDEYRELGKAIILRCKNSVADIEVSLGSMFYDNLVDVGRDAEFLKEIFSSNVSGRMAYSFVNFLEKNACSVKDYAEVIITLCENILSMSTEQLSTRWGIENDVSKLIIALYDETANSDNRLEQALAEKCLKLWDIMFEKQIGQVRDLSRILMER